MSNELELYHNILFISRPWLDNTTSEQKFRQLLHELLQENLAQQPIYELAFPKPLTAKQKYYYTVLNYEANRYLNNIHSLINQSSNDNEKKFWINTTLYKKLKDKLSQTETVIKKNKFFLADLNDNNKQQEHLDDTYVIQCLKYQLIRLYVEIQNSFSAYVKEDILDEEEIHKLYFREPQPDESFIIAALPLNLPKATTSIKIPEPAQSFNPIKTDIRESDNKILSYADIIAKPDRFALAEVELFNEGLLDQQYRFIKKHGNVEKMAALYHIMIQKKHFNPAYFKDGRKAITDLHIRKFLNHRYIAGIDKEFRNFKNRKQLEDYLNNHVALPLLIPS